MSKAMFGELPRVTSRTKSVDWAVKLAPLDQRTLKVVWDVSNKCNLRCKMCHFAYDSVFHRPAKYMKPEEFAHIAEKVLPYSHTLILSAGNEPLTSPWFAEILKIASQYNIPDLLFITNGTRLTPKIVDAVLESGVTQIQISIDGSTKHTYESIRKGASFDKLIKNIDYLNKRKKKIGSTLPRLQFNIVLMQSNIAELDGFIDLAEKLNVEWIAARHLLVMKGLDVENESLSLIPEEANMYFEQFFAKAQASSRVKIISFPDLFDVESINARKGSNRLIHYERPFGVIDSPVEPELSIETEIEFFGWALDSKQLIGICAERDPVSEDQADQINERGKVTIADAKIAQPRDDVGQIYPDFANSQISGWSVIISKNDLPLDFGPVSIDFIAFSLAGTTSVIGNKTVHLEYEIDAE